MCEKLEKFQNNGVSFNENFGDFLCWLPECTKNWLFVVCYFRIKVLIPHFIINLEKKNTKTTPFIMRFFHMFCYILYTPKKDKNKINQKGIRFYIKTFGESARSRIRLQPISIHPHANTKSHKGQNRKVKGPKAQHRKAQSCKTLTYLNS